MGLHTVVRACAAFVLIGLFTGCATAPDSRPFNAELHQDVTNVEILPMRESEPTVHIVNNPGHSFGLVGLLIAEGHMAPRRNWFREQVSEAEFDHMEFFVDALGDFMEERGYNLMVPESIVEPSSNRPARSMWGPRKSYKHAPMDDSHALLDINILFAGYASSGSGDGSPYRPTVVVSAKMVDPLGEEELFFDRLIYNNVFPGHSKSIVIFDSTEHAYANFEELQEADSATLEGFKFALESVARELAEQFAPRS